ncbi:MAG TPA: FixH family protein [Polyangiaceae bacterium]
MRLGAAFWAWLPAGLLATMLAGLAGMAVIASGDPSFALERDYYRKAADFDRELAQRAENARLAWFIDASAGAIDSDGRSPLVVRARTATDPVDAKYVRVEALRNAGASRVLEATLDRLAPGEYRADLPLERGGLWEFRLTLERGTERFTHVARLDVREPGP